jgi:hypothetical protein
MASPQPQRIWDISPPVHEGTPVFPGDTAYQQRWAATISPGCPVNVSEIKLSPHVGAHADAPLHYDPEGQAIGHVDLTPFLGPCRVIHAIDKGPLVEWEHIAHAVDSQLPPRVLVRTYITMPVGHWDPQDAGKPSTHSPPRPARAREPRARRRARGRLRTHRAAAEAGQRRCLSRSRRAARTPSLKPSL